MEVRRARYPRPSLAGRRLALERKFELNVVAYGGPVSLLTLTPPGAELLPWDPDKCKLRRPHKCSGDAGCEVEWSSAIRWNATHAARRQRMWEAAQRSADRYIARLWGVRLDRMPRQIGHARDVMQERGVLHDHWLLPQGSEVERVWSRHVRRWMEAQRRKEIELGSEVVWQAIDREFATGEGTRGIYGFGYSHPGRQGGSENRWARYVARNAAGYTSGQGSGHYVSTRLTAATGVTMRKLRAVNYLWVRRKLLEAGELEDAWVPSHWQPEWAEAVVALFARLQPAHAP